MSVINLLPAQVQHERKVALLNYYTLLAGIITISGALILAALLVVFDQVYKAQLENVTNQKRQAQAQTALHLDTEKKAQDLQKQLEALKRAQGQTTHWTTLLTELQRLTPLSVAIQSVDLKTAAANPTSTAAAATKTEISGRADSRRSLGELQVALSSSPYFKNVEILQSTLTSTGAVDYKISTDINFDKLNGPEKLQ